MVGNIEQTLSHTCHCDGFRLSPCSGFIGRLDAQKGYDLLLESLVEVLEDLIKKSHRWICELVFLTDHAGMHVYIE